MSEHDFRDNLASLVAAADQLASMSKYLAAPIASFFHALREADVPESPAATLCGVYLMHMLSPNVAGSDD